MKDSLRWADLGLTVPLHYCQLRSFRHFAGTRVKVLEGCGKDGHDLAREVTYWFDENGDLIARRDPKDEIEPEDSHDLR